MDSYKFIWTVKVMQAYFWTIFLALWLTACSSMTEPVTDLFGEDDNLPDPSPLVEFTPSLAITELWSESISRDDEELVFNLSLTSSSNKVVVANHEGEVTAFDQASGQELWQIETNVLLSAGPSSYDDKLFLGGSNGELLVLDLNNGQQLWQAHLNSEILALPVAAQGMVIVKATNGKVVAFNLENGQRLWQYQQSLPLLILRGSSSPVIDEDRVLLGFANGKLVALNLQDGAVLWETTIAIPRGRSEVERLVDINATPVINNSVVYVSAYQSHVTAVDLSTGVVLWQKEISSYQGLDATWGRLYVSDQDSVVWALDSSNGSVLWQQDKLKYRQISAPAIWGDYLVVGDFEGYLHYLNRNDGTFVARVLVDDKGIRHPPVVMEDVLYVYGQGGEVHAFSMAP